MPSLDEQKNKEDNRKKLKQDYNRVMATEAGRRVLEDLLNFSGVDSLGKGADVQDTYFRLGKQSVGLRIKQQLRGE